MAAQAAAAEHVVGQGLRSGRRVDFGDVLRSGQALPGPEMAADGVDHAREGKVLRASGLRDLFAVAGAAGSGHVVRVGWFGN